MRALATKRRFRTVRGKESLGSFSSSIVKRCVVLLSQRKKIHKMPEAANTSSNARETMDRRWGLPRVFGVDKERMTFYSQGVFP